MFAWFNDLVAGTGNFMPHGACYLWQPSLLLLHIISDGIIALAYYSIPFALFYFVKKRKDLAYRWVFVLFGVFICLCGTTHLISIWTIWYPDYWLDGFIKLATALVSIGTAILIWPLIPTLLKLPSPRLLQSSETYLRAIFDATPDAMLISDEQGIITMVNRQTERLLGYACHELLGLSIEILVPERYREAHPALRQEFANSGVARPMGTGRPVKALRKDGSELDVEISLSLIKTEQGVLFASALRDITERKRAEATLRESEARFRRMANSSPVMIWITNTVGMPIFVNQSWLDLTGLDLSQAMNHEIWLNTIHPDDRKIAFKEYYQQTENHQVITSEYRLRHANGDWRWILDKGTPLYDENGVFNGYIGSAIDITERKQAQQALQDKEQMLSESQRIAHIGSWSMDTTTGNMSWSEEMYRIYGITLETFGHSAKAFFDLVHSDDRMALKRWFSECLTEKAARELDFRIVLSDGSIRFIRSSAGLQYDEVKKTQYIVGCAQDITERKQTELALRESEELLRTITDNGNTLMFLKDVTGRYLHVNRQYEKLFHVTNARMQGKTDYDIFPKHVADVLIKNDQSVIQSGQLLEIEEQVPQDDGYHIYLSAKFPVHNIAGEIYAICGVSTDITERKHIELELHIAAVAFQSQEPIVITNNAGVILQINKAFTESTGYTEAEAIGQKVSILQSGRHDKAFYIAMWKNLLKTGSWQGEVWDRRKNGEIYPKWLSITGVKGKDGVITHYVGTHIDITERKSAEEQIKQLAFYDPLTQLPNRRLLQERLQYSISVDERNNNKQLALLMMDLDRFKAVNDSLGHLAGDELLQQVAERIVDQLRSSDTVARLGGDEFVVLLEDISHLDDAARIAGEIITNLSKPFKLTQCDDVRIGTSIGISLYPQHGNRLEILLDHADAALYQAKAQGRGCFAYFSEELTIATRERIALETRLRHAIEQQELRVYFQPQVDIISGRIVGAEALIRWQDPVEGLISPSRFIPIAEESGLIVELGSWVLSETCLQGRQWIDAGFPPLMLAVNVSAQQFRRSNICAMVATALAETGFPAEQLELEITESGLMENQDTAAAILNNLRAQGIGLAIDDFGTGYSSLAYLKHFPVNVLKIDKSFIEDIPFHQDDMEIAATIIAMGHILGFKVLAEGVETPEQLVFLQERGCDMYQGYLKSRALPADEFIELLRKQHHL